MTEPVMLYYGCWDEPGHFMFTESGYKVSYKEQDRCTPWKVDDLDTGAKLQSVHIQQREGKALLHHKDGWTVLSFWDRSIDTRFGSHSNYIAKGAFTFEQMVAMANIRFLSRWSKMQFPVVKAPKM